MALQMDPWQVQNLLRTKLETDLYTFGRGVLSLDFMYGPVHIPFCRFLERGYSRLGVVMPRGFLKTSVGTIARAIQHGCRDPDVRILLVTNTADNAGNLLNTIRTEFETNEILTSLWPNLLPRNRSVKWNSRAACLNRTGNYREATFMSASTGTKLVGLHWDKIFIDDIVQAKLDDVSGEEVFPSPEEITKANNWIRMSRPFLIDPLRSSIQYIGTRWCQDDCIHFIRDTMPHYKWYETTCRTDKGEPVYPTRFPEEALQQMELEMGPFIFATQMEGNPAAASITSFRKEWLVDHFCESMPKEGRNVVIVDPSKGRADPTAMVLVRYAPDGTMYVVDYVYEKIRLESLCVRIFRFLCRHNPDETLIESVAFQELILPSLQALMRQEDRRFLLTPVLPRSRERKHMRIDSLVPLVQNGDLRMRSGQHALLEEFLAYPFSNKNHLLDCLGYAIRLYKRPRKKRQVEQASKATFVWDPKLGKYVYNALAVIQQMRTNGRSGLDPLGVELHAA